jgi:hypothetical protein
MGETPDGPHKVGSRQVSMHEIRLLLMHQPHELHQTSRIEVALGT